MTILIDDYSDSSSYSNGDCTFLCRLPSEKPSGPSMALISVKVYPVADWSL